MVLKRSVDYKGDRGRIAAGIALAVVFLYFAGVELWWFHRDNAPPAWDDAWYLTNSLALYDSLVSGGVVRFGHEFFTVLGFKAPLIAAFPVPLYLILGRGWPVGGGRDGEHAPDVCAGWVVPGRVHIDGVCRVGDLVPDPVGKS